MVISQTKSGKGKRRFIFKKKGPITVEMGGGTRERGERGKTLQMGTEGEVNTIRKGGRKKKG